MSASRAPYVLRPRPIAACLAAALTLASSSNAAPMFAPDASAQDFVLRYRLAADRWSGHPLAAEHRAQPFGANTVLRVENCDDDGPGSLRDTIAAAGDPADIIDLSRLACSRITLTTGALTSDHDRLVLFGPGADKLAIDGGGSDRVFMHTGDWELKLIGLAVTNGATSGKGGCIYSSSRVHLYDSAITSCSAGDRGGAVYATTQFFTLHTTIADSVSQASGAAGGGAYLKSGFAGIVQSTMSGNSAPNGSGGALWTRDDTYISRSTLTGNSALDGGAFAASGSGFFNLAGSTVSANSAAHDGGGIHVEGDLRIADDTIAFNTAGASGGGVHASNVIVMQNAIVANNVASGVAGDVAGASPGITGANNIVIASSVIVPSDTLHDDPMLAPLADHGGFAMTHALLSGSVAIDNGNNASFMRYDQRNYASSRTVGSAPDIGAYEVQTIGSVATVTSCADSGEGSLRAAIANAKSGDTIDMSALGCGTIALSGAIEIAQGSLTLSGPGAGQLTIDGGGADRILRHTGYGALRISGITFANGASHDYDGGGCVNSVSTLEMSDSVVTHCTTYEQFTSVGGGIAAGRLVLARSLVTGNLSTAVLTASAGGIAVYGDLVMRDSTVSDNRAVTEYAHTEPKAFSTAGGVLVGGASTIDISGSTICGNVAGNAALELPGYSAGLLIRSSSFMTPARIANTTISGNIAASANGGLYVTSALTLRNSTIAGNTATTGLMFGTPLATGLHVDAPWVDISSTIIAHNASDAPAADLGGSALVFGANDLIMASTIAVPPDTLADDPLLGPLQDNGGPTWTLALAPESPAIDRGNNAAGFATDQRGDGFARVVGVAADIGAFERQDGIVDAIFASGFEAPR